MTDGPTHRPAVPPAALVVDARALRLAGLGRYLGEILVRLLRDPRFQPVTLLGNVADLEDFVSESDPVGTVRLHPLPPTFYAPRVHLDWLKSRVRGSARGDVYFFPHYDVPVVGYPARSVVTVHDLIHFKVPEAFGRWRRKVAGLVLGHAMRTSSRVITGSESARADLAERFPHQARKVEVVHHGISSAFLGDAPCEPAPGVGDGPFLLCVGNQKPHKNHVAAVEALARLAPQYPELRLVIVGRRFPKGPPLDERADRLGVGSRLQQLDEVSDAQLRWLYTRAEALLFPSLYEGFGLPIIEAMACGTPVVAADRSSIPEVVGDAGLLFDVNEPAALAELVGGLFRSPELRCELISRGRRRAAAFTWERAASRTAEILYEAAGVGAEVATSSATPPRRARGESASRTGALG